jgi:hypothetical protein
MNISDSGYSSSRADLLNDAADPFGILRADSAATTAVMLMHRKWLRMGRWVIVEDLKASHTSKRKHVRRLICETFHQRARDGVGDDRDSLLRFQSQASMDRIARVREQFRINRMEISAISILKLTELLGNERQANVALRANFYVPSESSPANEGLVAAKIAKDDNGVFGYSPLFLDESVQVTFLSKCMKVTHGSDDEVSRPLAAFAPGPVCFAAFGED